MRRPRIIAALIVGLLALFVPFIKVVTVPTWTVRVVDEQGNPQAGVEVRQHWNHYSFDGSSLSGLYGGEETRASDSNGEITFPERSFYTGFFRWAFAAIGTPLRWINVHTSTGPHSFLMCMGNRSCDGPSYRGNEIEEKHKILTVESEETIRKQMEKVTREVRENGDGSGSGGGLDSGDEDSEPTMPRPPPPKRRANN